MEQSLKEMLQKRIERNKILFETEAKIQEENSEYKDSPRYTLQDFHNGKGDGTDHETGYDGPSDYEAWRRGIIDKKRKKRLEQDNFDRNSEFSSYRNTTMPKETLDSQEDQFLSWYIKTYGDKK